MAASAVQPKQGTPLKIYIAQSLPFWVSNTQIQHLPFRPIPDQTSIRTATSTKNVRQMVDRVFMLKSKRDKVKQSHWSLWKTHQYLALFLVGMLYMVCAGTPHSPPESRSWKKDPVPGKSCSWLPLPKGSKYFTSHEHLVKDHWHKRILPETWYHESHRFTDV
jgi:hypothetical protein